MRKKFLIFTLPVLFVQSGALACDVCQAQQPPILRDLTHGSGPQGSFDFVIVIAASAIVLFTLIYAVKYLVFPGEGERKHIKRMILNPDHNGN